MNTPFCPDRLDRADFFSLLTLSPCFVLSNSFLKALDRGKKALDKSCFCLKKVYFPSFLHDHCYKSCL